MKDVVKTIQTVVHQDVDKETGEVLGETVKKIRIVTNTDEFSLIYAGFWNVLLDSPLSKSDIELLAYILRQYSDGTPFTINKIVKTTVGDITGKSHTSYDKSTSVLLKHGLIFAINGSRIYKVNPKFAFKGSSKQRNKAIIEMINENV